MFQQTFLSTCDVPDAFLEAGNIAGIKKDRKFWPYILMKDIDKKEVLNLK